jgi:hypothetical protein
MINICQGGAYHETEKTVRKVVQGLLRPRRQED